MLNESHTKNSSIKPIQVSFICLGNICRSPLAEAVFKSYLGQYYPHLEKYFIIQSGGTGSHTIGEAADPRCFKIVYSLKMESFHQNILDVLSSHSAKPISCEAILNDDYLLVMDEDNFGDVKSMWKNCSKDGSNKTKHQSELQNNFISPMQPLLTNGKTDLIQDRLFYFGNFSTFDTIEGENSPSFRQRKSDSENHIIEDPYYGTDKDFLKVYEQCLQSSKGFINYLTSKNHFSPSDEEEM